MTEQEQLERLRAALSDRYRVDREVGQGGMATVYLAQDLRHRRAVALKVLHPDLAVAAGSDRFLREVQTTAGLRHPNVLALYDSGEADGFLYYTMPLVEGESLRDRLARERQLPVEEAVRIAREVALALDHAHRRDVLHRDIKPANILLEGSRVLLADFGIARAAGLDTDERLTQTGLAVGTPAYMSPEQSVAERDLDGRSDLYTLGCVLYEMLAGEPPYSGPTAQAILAKRFHGPVPRVSTLRNTVSPGLDAIVLRLLATSPVDRYPNAAEVVRALEDHASAPGVPPGEGTGVGRTGSGKGARPGRRYVSGVVALAVVAVAAFGAVRFLGDGGGPGASAISPDVLVVLPFTVRGSQEFDYLGEGMVDLLGAKLDGAGALRVVSPRAVIAMVNTDDVDLMEPAEVDRVAQRFGAGRYLTGEVTEIGGRLRLAAQLHATGGVEAPARTATIQTAPDRLFDAVDSLAFRLLAETMDAPDARIRRLATATTSSLPALKEFLEGERFMRAGGQYREAAEAFDRAIELDPEFALAWYRKSSVGEWIDLYDVRSSADSARKYAEGLSRRDRSLLEALWLRRIARIEESEAAFVAHLQTWPDEVDALVQLGEMRFHDNPRLGRRMDEAIPYFQAALALEPANADARIHLARLYALTGQLDSLQVQVEHVEEDFAQNSETGDLDGGEGERLLEVRALRAFALGDSAAKARVMDQLAGRPVSYFFVVAHGVSRFARDPAGALEIVRSSRTVHPFLQWTEASLYQVLGRHAEYFRFTDALRRTGSPQWDLERAFVLTSGVLAPDEARMEAVLQSLRSADPAEIRRESWVPAYEDLTDDFHRFELDWNVALLLIHLGRTGDARGVMAELEAMAPMPGMGNLQPDAIRMLEAEILHREGDAAGALEVLREITYEAPHGSTYRAFADGTRARYLRAELELELGDRAAAERLFRGFDQSWSPWDGYHRALAYRRLGEIAEADGRTDDALRYYGLLVDLWRECDQGLVPLREEIRGRMERLAAT